MVVCVCVPVSVCEIDRLRCTSSLCLLSSTSWSSLLGVSLHFQPFAWSKRKIGYTFSIGRYLCVWVWVCVWDEWTIKLHVLFKFLSTQNLLKERNETKEDERWRTVRPNKRIQRKKRRIKRTIMLHNLLWSCIEFARASITRFYIFNWIKIVHDLSSLRGPILSLGRSVAVRPFQWAFFEGKNWRI